MRSLKRSGVVWLDDLSRNVAIDGNSDIYISGNTQGSVRGANQGGTDAWVTKVRSNGLLDMISVGFI